MIVAHNESHMFTHTHIQNGNPFGQQLVQSSNALSFSFVRPVIVTDVGALSEMVDDGKTGIIIPPNSEKHLSLSIRFLSKFGPQYPTPI